MTRVLLAQSGIFLAICLFSLVAGCGDDDASPADAAVVSRDAMAGGDAGVMVRTDAAGTDAAGTDAGGVVTGDPIPADRRIAWGGNSGVPGGIPARSTNCATLGAPGRAPTDVQAVTAAQIEAAIASCPPGQTVLLAQGTYNIGSINLATHSGVTLRGAGPGKTIIDSSESGNAVIYSDQYSFSGATSITAGSTKGSTRITLSSASGFAVGNLMQLDQNDDTDFVLATEGPERHMKFVVRVTAIDGNDVTFAPPLPYALSSALDPQAAYLNGGPGLSDFGIEAMTIRNTGGADNIISFVGAYACWVKNVELTEGRNAFVFFVGSLQCELRDSYIHHAANAPDNSDGYGIYVYAASTYCLVENNIFDTLFVAMLQSFSSANSYLYNFARNGVGQGFPHQVGIINAGHGSHNMMTLWEGNVAEQWQHDGYHGSASHQTIFRNWIHGIHPTNHDNRKMIDAARGSYYYNVVGNVLGSDWATMTDPISRYEMTGEPGYDEQQVIYRLGYPNVANNGIDSANPWPAYSLTYPDAKVATTMIRHGNYDYFSAAAVWDPTITEHSLPNSLYYSSQPAWWPAGFRWPPIGSDQTPMLSAIPAQSCYDDATHDASGAIVGFDATLCY